MAKYKDILGNERVYENSTVTISLGRYNDLIIKEAIADCLVESEEKDVMIVVRILKKMTIKGRKEQNNEL